MAKEISKSLIIGLGGTGQKVIIALKKRLYQRFGEIPNVVKFLSIDTGYIRARDENFSFEYNGKRYKQIVEINPGEQFYISKKNLLEYYEDENRFKDFTPKDFLQYAPTATDGLGAEGIRLVGKMLVSTEYSALKDKIHDITAHAIHQDVEQEAIIDGYAINKASPFLSFIVGSWAGGTGSGIFKDVTDILHNSHVLTNKHLLGFFAMPEFYKEFANTENVRVNAYCAFIETDHLQNPKYYGKEVKENIKTFDGHYIKRPRFNSIYIMQNILNNGNKISKETMEDATSAAISNLISAIGEEVAESMVNNHQVNELTKLKRRLYSGFGVCEVVLKRNELINYILNKIIIHSLSDYVINNYDENEFVAAVDDFINENNLDEGIGDEAKIINQLIDSIFELNHLDLNVVFPECSLGESVDEDLKRGNFDFTQELGQKADSIFLEYDLEKVKKALIERLSNLLYNRGGLSRTKYFAEIFIRQLNEMKIELIKEINYHEDHIEDITCNQLESVLKEINIKQKGTFSFFKKRQIKELMNNYKYIVSDPINSESIRNHFLDVKRKKKAVEIFNKLIDDAKIFYYKEGPQTFGKVALLEGNIEQSMSDIGLAIRQFQPDLSDNIKIDINFFFKKLLENKSVFDEIINSVHIDFASFIKEKQNLNNLTTVLKEHIVSKIDENNKTILWNLSDINFSLEDLIMKYKKVDLRIGDEKIGYKTVEFGAFLTQTIKEKISMMWNYKDTNHSDDEVEAIKPEKIFIIGNYDGKKNFFTHEVINSLQIKNIKAHGINRVATNDRNRITMHIQENAVAAFKIKNMDKYSFEYHKKKNLSNSYFFSDMRFEKYAEDIFPQEDREKLLNLWTFGLITGLIFNRRRAYYIKSSTGTEGVDVPCFQKNSAVGKNDRYLAYEYFISSNELIKEMEDKLNSWFDNYKERLRTKLLDYFHNQIFTFENIGKRLNSCNEKEKELLQNERKAIIEIGLDLGMHDNDFINTNLTGKELENHKNELRNLGLEEVY